MNRDLNFAQVREDPLIELDLFSSVSAGRFFTIASGGCTALSLLLLNPQRVFAVDINPAQEALVALKCVAFRNLGFHDFQSFIGNRTSADRREVYGDLRGRLTPNHRRFWDSHAGWITEGVQNAGRAE